MPAEEYVDLGWSDALSDLSDSDDASDAPAPRASLQRAAKKAKPAYTIQTHLRPPRTTQYTAESLYRAFFSSLGVGVRRELMEVQRCLGTGGSMSIRTTSAVCATHSSGPLSAPAASRDVC